jgi:hypothetical protein
MIHYLVTAQHRYTADWFLRCEPSMAGSLVVLPYDEAIRARTLPAGTYVFSDLERLARDSLRAAVGLWDRLRQLGGTTLLNDPSCVPSRYELVRALHARGINEFNAYPLADVLSQDDPTGRSGASPPPAQPRFPVFVREGREHTKSLTSLLRSWEEVRVAAAELGAKHRLEDLLLVEWCDTSDAEGVFRKYGAFVIGDTIVPRALMCARQWVVQDYELLDERYMQEAREYLAANPHAEFLRRVARENGIDYGRFDYAFLDGRPQIWEINTNPCVIVPPGEEEIGYELHRVPMQRIAAALKELDARSPRNLHHADGERGGFLAKAAWSSGPRKRAGNLLRRLRRNAARRRGRFPAA